MDVRKSYNVVNYHIILWSTKSKQAIKTKYREKTLDYRNVIIPTVITILNEFRSAGIEMTVRGMFYRLVSVELINNTYEVYKKLDAALTRYRKNDVLPINCFVDNTRKIIDIQDEYLSPQRYVDLYVEGLKHIHQNYLDRIPRWYNQFHYVEIWLEKDTMTSTFESILQDRQVRIVSNHGWSSLTFAEENIRRLKKIHEKYGNEKKIHVLYFGDYDPSGMAMSLRINNQLDEALGKNTVGFKRVGILKEHIKTFKLQNLKNTKPEVIEKLKKDPNRQTFMDDNNGELFQIELEALQGKGATKLKTLVLPAVDQYFDDEMYEQVLSDPRHSENMMKRMVFEGARSLLES
jgi:hypothetical protein